MVRPFPTPSAELIVNERGLATPLYYLWLLSKWYIVHSVYGSVLLSYFLGFLCKIFSLKKQHNKTTPSALLTWVDPHEVSGSATPHQMSCVEGLLSVSAIGLRA